MNYRFYYSNNNGQDDYGFKGITEDGFGLKCSTFKVKYPPQEQFTQPGMEYLMQPRPVYNNQNYKASGKLKDKVAIITGGDSGIGRAVAVAFVKEGAKVVISYLNEHKDAEETKQVLDSLGGESLFLSGDIKERKFCDYIVEETIKKYLEEYPTIKLVIDVHRDSIVKSSGEMVRPVAELDGEAAAQIMCVVGSDWEGDGYPDWENNLSLALKLREKLNSEQYNICRPVNLKGHTYNQELSAFSLLLEVGAAGNSLVEAQRSAKLIGEKLCELLKEI